MDIPFRLITGIILFIAGLTIIIGYILIGIELGFVDFIFLYLCISIILLMILIALEWKISEIKGSIWR